MSKYSEKQMCCNRNNGNYRFLSLCILLVFVGHHFSGMSCATSVANSAVSQLSVPSVSIPLHRHGHLPFSQIPFSKTLRQHLQSPAVTSQLSASSNGHHLLTPVASVGNHAAAANAIPEPEKETNNELEYGIVEQADHPIIRKALNFDMQDFLQWREHSSELPVSNDLPKIIKQNQPLIVVGGATATGKSDLGVALAKLVNGEIISADSMQIYKGLEIAVNTITPAEMGGIRHHMIGILDDPNAKFTVDQFRKKSLRIMKTLVKKGKMPMLVGGSVPYIESILFKQDDTEKVVNHVEHAKNDERRELVDKFGTTEKLYAELKRVNPEAAEGIFECDADRIVDALVGNIKGNATANLRFKNTLVIILEPNMTVQKKRVATRVFKMFEKRMLDQFEQFYTQHEKNLSIFGLFKCIGWNALLPYLSLPWIEKVSPNGRKLLEKCIDKFGNGDWEYSKMQNHLLKERIYKPSHQKEISPMMVVLDASQDFESVIIPYAEDLTKYFMHMREQKKIDG